MTRQVEIFGPEGGASDTTMLQVLDELAGRLNSDGLPGRRLARAMASARANAWTQIVARHGHLPAVRVAGADLTRPATTGAGAGEQSGRAPRPVLVAGVDATLLEADSTKAGAVRDLQGRIRIPSVDRVVHQRGGQPRGDAAPG